MPIEERDIFFFIEWWKQIQASLDGQPNQVFEFQIQPYNLIYRRVSANGNNKIVSFLGHRKDFMKKLMKNKNLYKDKLQNKHISLT